MKHITAESLQVLREILQLGKRFSSGLSAHFEWVINDRFLPIWSPVPPPPPHPPIFFICGLSVPPWAEPANIARLAAHRVQSQIFQPCRNLAETRVYATAGMNGIVLVVLASPHNSYANPSSYTQQSLLAGYSGGWRSRAARARSRNSGSSNSPRGMRAAPRALKLRGNQAPRAPGGNHVVLIHQPRCGSTLPRADQPRFAHVSELGFCERNARTAARPSCRQRICCVERPDQSGFGGTGTLENNAAKGQHWTRPTGKHSRHSYRPVVRSLQQSKRASSHVTVACTQSQVTQQNHHQHQNMRGT